MNVSLRDVWQAFLTRLIVFFSYKKPDDPVLDMLRLELEYAHVEKQRLLKVIEGLGKPRVEITPEAETDWKPIGRESWQAKARRLTEESIQKRKQMESVAIKSIDELEQELAIGDSNA